MKICSVKLLNLILFALLTFFISIAKSESNFDHSTTSFQLTGQHSILACESCHIRGIFKGLPDTCEGCHEQFSHIGGSLKPLTHVSTNASCDDCHTDNSWAAVRMDHAEITDACITCHNNISNTGKPAGHVESDDSCDDCHLPVSWIPARFDHFGITDTCITCHNNAPTIGKPVGHVASDDVCEDCHYTTGWLPASFKHIGITDNCFSCHNPTNVSASPKPNNHVPSTDICEDCHKSTKSWLPALFIHDENTTDCNSCHYSGGSGTYYGSSHLMTTRQCDSCHYVTGWGLLRPYSHDSPNYPGEHTGVNLDCFSCHKEKTETLGWVASTYYPDCAACHVNDFDNEKHEGLTVNDIPDCAGTCHKPNPEHQLFHDDWGQ